MGKVETDKPSKLDQLREIAEAARPAVYMAALKRKHYAAVFVPKTVRALLEINEYQRQVLQRIKRGLVPGDKIDAECPERKAYKRSVRLATHAIEWTDKLAEDLEVAP